MVSRRNFFSITIIMCIVFFLFQFLNVAKEHLDHYEINSNKTEVSQLKDQKDAEKAAATQVSINGKQMVFIGKNSQKATGKMASDWAGYRKWSIKDYTSIQAYQTALSSGAVEKPYLILIQAEDIDWKNQETTKLLQNYVNDGVQIVFSGLPDVTVIKENEALRNLLGIRSIRQDSVTVDGIQIYDGLLLGGDTFYQAQTEEDEKNQDLQFTFPWYELSSGTRTYIKGMFQDTSVKAENYPPVLWRKSFEQASVFVVNGDYMEDDTGLGLLSGMVSELNSYDIYPVVNSQNLVIADYPGLTNENDVRMQELYSQSMRGIFRDIIWPTLVSVSIKNEQPLSCMFSPQLDYSQGIQMGKDSIKDLNYYMSLLNKEKGEGGLSGDMVSDIGIQKKLDIDKTFMQEGMPSYVFSSLYQGNLSSDDLNEALKDSFLEGVRTVVENEDSDNDLFGYVSDTVTRQKATADGYTHTYRDDLRIRSIESALGYSSILTDISRVSYPESDEDVWEKLSEKFSSYTDTYWKDYEKFDRTTVSGCDTRIRNFMNMNYTEERDGNLITVKTENTDGSVWFLLRLHNEDVKNVIGGTAEKIEDGFWLICGEKSDIKILLDSSETLFYTE